MDQVSKYIKDHWDDTTRFNPEDSGNLIGNNLSAFSKEEMTAFAQSIRAKLPNVTIRGV